MSSLMNGKRGLIMGLANDKSLAWGIAQKLAEHGAELAFSYQGEALGKRVMPLAASVLIGPALIALTRMFSGPRSLARYCTLVSSAALATPMTL